MTYYITRYTNKKSYYLDMEYKQSHTNTHFYMWTSDRYKAITFSTEEFAIQSARKYTNERKGLNIVVLDDAGTFHYSTKT